MSDLRVLVAVLVSMLGVIVGIGIWWLLGRRPEAETALAEEAAPMEPSIDATNALRAAGDAEARREKP